MKKILSILCLIISIIATNAQENPINLTVKISGLQSSQGTLLIGLYNQKKDFLKKEFRGNIATINNKTAVVTFKNIPKGEYAVSFVHDENNNKKMDTNFFGIPKEDYGCSNNAVGFMGPPKYKDAKFSITENKTIAIKIN